MDLISFDAQLRAEPLAAMTYRGLIRHEENHGCNATADRPARECPVRDAIAEAWWSLECAAHRERGGI